MDNLLKMPKSVNFCAKIPYYFATTALVVMTVGCQSIDESMVNKNTAAGGVNSKSQETDEYFWSEIKNSKNENAMLEYISKFPNGKNINEAKLRLRLIKIGVVK